VSQFYRCGTCNFARNKKWENPAKLEAKPEAMNTPKDFGRFIDLMKKIVEKPKPASPKPRRFLDTLGLCVSA